MLGLAKKILGRGRRFWVASLISRHAWGHLSLEVLWGDCRWNWLSIILASKIVAGTLLLESLIQVAVWLIIGCTSSLIILNKLWAGIVVSLIGNSSFSRRDRRTFLIGFPLSLGWRRRDHSPILHPILVLILALLPSGVLSFIMICYSIFCCIIWAWHNVAKFERHGRVERRCVLELLPPTVMKIMIVVICWSGRSSWQFGIARTSITKLRLFWGLIKYFHIRTQRLKVWLLRTLSLGDH
jgi:hypothetical protein